MNTVSTLRARGARAFAALSVLAMSAAVQAQTTTDPISTMLDSVDLSGIIVKIVAAGLVIVGIALAFKGPDVSKRVVRKI